jgi:hypothetical protein
MVNGFAFGSNAIRAICPLGRDYENLSHQRNVLFSLRSCIRRLSWLACIASVQAASWPGFRGPAADGIAEKEKVPTHFGQTRNLLWKTEILRGHSSPAIWNGLYIASDRGTVTVVKAGDSVEVLARNGLGEPIIASPAIADIRSVKAGNLALKEASSTARSDIEPPSCWRRYLCPEPVGDFKGG